MSHPTDFLPSLVRSQTQLCLRQTEQGAVSDSAPGGGTQLVRRTKTEVRTRSNKEIQLKVPLNVLYAKTQRMDLRTRGGGRVSWDEVREWHGHIDTTKHKIDS